MDPEKLASTAYHEAGHAAVNAFLDVYGPSHFVRISVNDAVISHSFIFLPILNRSEAKRTIMFYLAGHAAQVHSGYSLDLEDIEFLIEYDFYTAYLPEEEWRQITDEGRALTIAEYLSNKSWTPRRILLLLYKWTHEVLDIPDVWNVVDNIAQRLITKGEITDTDEYMELVDPVLWSWRQYPIWRRRLKLT